MSLEREALAIVGDRDANPVAVEPDTDADERGQRMSSRIHERLADDLMDLAGQLGSNRRVEAPRRRLHVQLDGEIPLLLELKHQLGEKVVQTRTACAPARLQLATAPASLPPA